MPTFFTLLHCTFEIVNTNDISLDKLIKRWQMYPCAPRQRDSNTEDKETITSVFDNGKGDNLCDKSMVY